MHRRPLFELLTRYRRVFPQEFDVVDRICALVDRHANCFDRSCRPGHVTGSAWILSADRRRHLLTYHGKLGRWLQLGGHADGQSHVEEVALREAREESGMLGFDFVRIDGELLPLDVDVHEIPARFDPAGRLIEEAHEHHDIRFLLVAHAGQDVHASQESHRVDWFTPEEVLRLTDEESVLRMMRKTLLLIG
jgi:8-oxo-dGTP pyrophosphatase MutT (NUDIX family)